MNLKLKINKSNIIILILLLVYLKPANVVLWPHVNSIYQVIKVIITLVIVFLFLKKGARLDRNSLLCLSFLVVWSISIYLNNGTLGIRLQELLSIIGMLMLFKWIGDSKNKIILLLSIVDKIAKIYVILELITILLDKPLFASAVVSYDRYFLGSDNYSAFILIPLASFIFVYSYIRNSKITLKAWFFSAIGFLDLAIPISTTGMVSYGLMLLAIILIRYPNIRNFFTVKKITFMMILFLIAVIGFNIQNNFATILSVVGKVGLNSREIIWPKAIRLILEKPLIGWGKLTERQIASYALYGADHTHNVILEFLVDTGLIGTILVFLWMEGILKNSIKTSARYVQIVQVCIAIYMLCAIFDFYIGLIYFWMMFFVLDMLNVYASNELMK